MYEDFKNKFDLSISRRKYFSKDCGLTNCPECNSKLTEDSCTVLIYSKSDTDEGNFLSNLTGSRFCNTCRVIVFDSEKIDKAVSLGMKGVNNLIYEIRGIIDFNAIPPDKRHLELGIDENPVPLVRFLPDLNKTTAISGIKTGRNELCPCGSGKKFKKCCG